IGDIAIIEIPKSLEAKEAIIAEAVCKVHPNIKVVAKKEGPMEGEYRTRKIKVIYGEQRTETEYRENGTRILVDIAKVYFSPRLSFERKRIAGLVKDGENVLALFAGVGPFPLVIAKEHKKCNIVAIELNPEGARYMEKNIKLNKLVNVKVVLGDVNEVVPHVYQNWADRVIMPLPKDAEFFLKAAYVGAKDNATIHFYTFANIKNPFGDARKKAEAHLPAGKYHVIAERIVRPFSPSKVQVVLDILVKK
ncbi:MAG: class I SAM-dependent methyltransferase, partial [Candidatus Paceibacteria bacterium]